ncbi:uncharacterized protein CTRU02_202839 [Colletotrichum truncatum]|uniref:Uncharacterized protein n=1 Tax=Colletotrichum truncatum TaxID=5467 RepID=A0ACC3ZLE7_COLTU
MATSQEIRNIALIAKAAISKIDPTKFDVNKNTKAEEIISTIHGRWDEHLKEKATERLRREQDISRVQRRNTENIDLEAGNALNAILSRAGNGHDQPIPDVKNSSGFGRYYQGLIREDIEHDSMMAERHEAINSRRRPQAKHLYIIHIGWTKKTKDEVDEACWAVEESFGPYSLLKNNCQHFVRLLANAIVAEKSQDWDWFQALVQQRGDYAGPEGLGPPAGLARLWIKKLEEFRKTGHGHDPTLTASIEAQTKVLNVYLAGMMGQINQAFTTIGRNAMMADQAAGGAAIG